MRRYGAAFDRVAAAYERNRPAYPDKIVDRACRIAGVGPGDLVLELGCGTGQLTAGLLARGLRVTAVEPGGQLVALAGRRLVGAVEFVNARFEDAQLPPERYRAAFSAAAFQWIDPDVSWKLAAAVLAPGGTLALVQYCGLREERSRLDQAALIAALAEIAPEITAGLPVHRDLASTLAGARERRGNVSEVWAWLAGHDVARPEAGRLFGDVRIAATPTLTEHTADQLNALLRTASFYQRMSPGQRQAIEAEHMAIHERLGRPIRSSMAAVLVTARRIE